MAQTGSLFDHTPAPEILRVATIVFDNPLDKEFDYIVPEALPLPTAGQRVAAPFGRGNKLTAGFCVGIRTVQNVGKLKQITEILDAEPLIDEDLMKLAEWISEYYVCPLGQVLSAMVPAGVKRGMGLVKRRYAALAVEGAALEEAKALLRAGSKQKLILEYLESVGACKGSAGVEVGALKETLGSSPAPLRKLVEASLVVVEKRAEIPAEVYSGKDNEAAKLQLNHDQQTAMNHITAEINACRFGVSLIHGVTGSGKTELYIRALIQAQEQGKGGIILLPEIALTAQTINRFTSRLQGLAVLHSRLTDAQRSAEWHRIKAGLANIVIGARSAIFAPLKRLGVVIVDEEHESTYKQDTSPRYNARDLAVVRCGMAKAHCILGSATPSFESYYNARNKKHYKLLELPNRVMELPMPQVEAVDMSSRFDFLTGIMIGETLKKEIARALDAGEQAILLLNRRGYSNFIYCPSCNYQLHCRNCDAALNYHLNQDDECSFENALYLSEGFATCHHCGSKQLVPKNCPACRAKLTMRGSGSQRLEEELRDNFPQARIARVDTDSMKDKDYFELIEKFSEHEIDILAGTQMLAKGLHFPNVTLVGVVNADVGLAISDFRSSERTFSLISQVSGRTGRGDKSGRVIVQTTQINHASIQFALRHDFKGFYENQMPMRSMLGLPPVRRQAVIQLRHEKHDMAEKAAEEMFGTVGAIISSRGFDIKPKGPFEPSIGRVGREFRFNIALSISDSATMLRFFKVLRALPVKLSGAKVIYDIDPVF
jgi:primosomal protein N' (replication factor Y)